MKRNQVLAQFILTSSIFLSVSSHASTSQFIEMGHSRISGQGYAYEATEEAAKNGADRYAQATCDVNGELIARRISEYFDVSTGCRFTYHNPEGICEGRASAKYECHSENLTNFFPLNIDESGVTTFSCGPGMCYFGKLGGGCQPC